MLRIMKLIGALLLVVSLSLPMSTCTRTDPVQPGQSDATTPHTHIEYRYVFSHYDFADPEQYIYLFAFLWLPAAALLSNRPKSRLWHAIIFWVQPVLLAWTIYVVAIIGWLFGKPASGAYVAASGVALYAVAWLIEAATTARRWIVQYRTAPSS